MIQYPLGINGVTVRVLDSGGDGDLLVMLHGVGSRADRFRPNVKGFGQRGYRAIAVDLPGHGLADKGAHPYSIPYYATFLHDLVSEMGYERAHIIGTSMGGHIGAFATVQNPDHVSSLTMIGTLGIVPLGLTARTAIANSIRNRTREGIAAKLRFVCYRHELITSDWVEEEYRINNSPGSTLAFTQLSDYFANHVDEDVVGEQLRDLADAVPLLLVWGTNDEMVTVDIAHSSHGMLSNSPLVLMESTGHGPYFERSDDFNALVADFLSGGLKGSETRTI